MRQLPIFCILLSLMPIYIYFEPPEYMDRDIIGLLLMLSSTILLLFLLRKEEELKLKGKFIKHSTFFLFGFFIVQFQYPLDFILGNVDESFTFIWIDNRIVVKALALSTIGLIVFILGYYAYIGRPTVLALKNNDVKSYSTKILIAISAILLVAYFYFANPLYLMGYYGYVDAGSEAGYVVLIFRVFVFAIVIQESRNLRAKEITPKNILEYLKYYGVVFNLTLFVYLLSVLISGDRGPLIYFSVALLSGYLFVTNKKVNLLKSIAILLLGAFSITILGKIRSQDREISFSKRLVESLLMDSRFETKSVSPQTQELASSIRALHYTMSYVPSQHDFLYGRFQMQQLFSTIPFGRIWTDVLYSSKGYKYGSSSKFITWIEQGDYPYSGVGSSVLADFYFDLGFLGVIIGMFIFGYLMRFAEIEMYSQTLPSLFSHAFFFGYLSMAIYIPRSTFLMELKEVLWIYFLLIINKSMFNKP